MVTRTVEELEGLIRTLHDDIQMFGAAGDDLERLENYKKELRNLLKED